MGDIAKEIGVSKTTVSRAINNKSDISPETKDKILDIVKKYNYQPSALAQGMKNYKSFTLGVIIPHDIDYVLMNPFYDEILRGIVKSADRSGYYILLIHCNKKNYLNVIYQDRIDGLLVISPGLNHKTIINNIKESGMPYVMTSNMLGDTDSPRVCAKNYEGAQLAVKHLVSLGHKKIAFINGPHILSSSIDRLNGYKDVLSKYLIPYREELVVEGANTIESGFLAMENLIKKELLTAAFVASDFMAFGVINAIQQMGLSIPEDISVVGFDDIPLAKFMNPPLTTISQSIFEKAEKSVDLLIDIINKVECERIQEIDVELVVRKSTSYPLK